MAYRVETKGSEREGRMPLFGKILRGLALPAVLSGASLVIPSIAGAASPALSVRPSLTPSFDPAIHDYATTCARGAVHVDVGGSGPVTIAGRTFVAPTSQRVPLVAGQQVIVAWRGAPSFHIRCLPADFPSYQATKAGRVQSQGFLVQPNINLGQSIEGPYTIAFDANGVPVWWHSDGPGSHPMDGKFLDATTVAWNEGGSYVLRDLAGNQLSSFTGPDTSLDPHDFLRLPNGNFVGLEYLQTSCPGPATTCLDLTSWGKGSAVPVIDAKIIEFDPAGQVVWTWSAAEHIDIVSENSDWRNQGGDLIHANSLAYDGAGGIIMSARHLNAVYRIDMTSGDVTWKLGGTTTPQSLRIKTLFGDYSFSGQHYAEMLPDGTLTLHDNRTHVGSSPLGLHFRLNLDRRTATLLSSVSDTRVATSICCGNAYLLDGGHWVADWGASNFVTELKADGQAVMSIAFDNRFSYRVAPVMASIVDLRRGMDASIGRARLAAG